MEKTEILEKLEAILADKPWNIDKNLRAFVAELRKTYVPKQRTSSQNDALHLAFEMLANSLNESGLEMKILLKQDYRLWWTKESVKEHLFKPFMRGMFPEKTSTTQLSKLGEIDKIWDKLMLELGERHGVEYINFPHDPNKPSGVN